VQSLSALQQQVGLLQSVKQFLFAVFVAVLVGHRRSQGVPKKDAVAFLLLV